MAPQKYLHALIRTLSAAEKRYFTLFLNRTGKRKGQLYSQLFQVIDGQEVYDESGVKTHFTGTSFEKSLAFPKSHLYTQVLRALQSYHYEGSARRRLRSYLDKIELLEERGLHEQALRLLRKRQQLAEELEWPEMVLDFLRLERNLVLKLQGPGVRKSIEAISQAEQYWERLHTGQQAARRLHDDLYLAIQENRRKSKAREDTSLKTAEAAIEQLLQEGELPFDGRRAALRARCHFYHLMDDFSAVNRAYAEEVALWQAHPRHIELRPDSFIRTYSAWLNSKILTGETDDLLAELEKLRATPKMDPPRKALIFKITYSLELFFHLNDMAWQRALRLVPALEFGLNKHRKFLSPGALMGFYHNLAVLHWMAGKWTVSLKWTQEVMGMKGEGVRQDILQFAPLLEKILCFELGRVGAIEAWQRAFRYQVRKGNKEEDSLEGRILALLLALLDEYHDGQRETIYRDFLEDLELRLERVAVSKLGLEELRIWIQSHLK